MSEFPPDYNAKQIREDSAKFNFTFVDNTIRSETDGGYVFTRPRNTRPSLRIFNTGFTDMSQEQKNAIETFVISKRVGAVPFTYTDPTSGVEYTVRFKAPPRFTYSGVGGTHRWSADVQLEEA